MHNAMDQQEADHEHRGNKPIHGHVRRKVYHAKQLAARHRLNAIFTASEGGLQAEEVDHLRQCQRDHGEVNALTANGDPTKNRPLHAGQKRAHDDGKLRRKPPNLGAMRCNIAAHAKIGRMTEGGKPDIPNQQIEGASKQGEAEQLHQEDGIEKKWCHDQRYKHNAERDKLRLREAEDMLLRANRRRSACHGMTGHGSSPPEKAGRTRQQDNDHDDEDDSG